MFLRVVGCLIVRKFRKIVQLKASFVTCALSGGSPYDIWQILFVESSAMFEGFLKKKSMLTRAGEIFGILSYFQSNISRRKHLWKTPQSSIELFAARCEFFNEQFAKFKNQTTLILTLKKNPLKNPLPFTLLFFQKQI